MNEELSEQEDPGGSFRLHPAVAAVTVEDTQSVPIDGEQIRATATRLLQALGAPADAMLSVTFVDAEQIATLKEQALGVHAATDVLSFPMDDMDDPSPGPVVLGDIVICPKVAQRQARALGVSLEEEITQLLCHGLLHIVGREHDGAPSERAMAAEERALLGALT